MFEGSDLEVVMGLRIVKNVITVILMTHLNEVGLKNNLDESF